MNRSFKDELKLIYDAPEPVRKDAFLKQHHRREITIGELIKTQAGYISKFSWFGSLVLFLTAIVFARYISNDTIWAMASLMPAFAMLLLVENGRAAYYGMVELELSSRFSLCVAGMARLAAVGMTQMFLVLLLLPIFTFYEIGTIIQGAAYLLVPYLASVILGLMAARKLKSKDSIYGCIGSALVVEVVQYIAYNIQPAMYAPRYQFIWIILLLGALIITAWQLYRTSRGMEELRWNWSQAN